MRVVIIGFDYTMLAEGGGEPGDTRERHIKYASALRSDCPGSRIDVLLRVPPSWSPQPVDIDEGLTVHPIPCRRHAFALKAMVRLHNLFRRQPFDLITTQTPFDDGLVGVLAKWRFGVPLNVQMRSSFLDLPHWISERPVLYRAFNLLGKWVAARADTIRVVSDGEKQRLERRFDKLNGKVTSLHPLVNTTIFDRPSDGRELAQVQHVLTSSQLEGRPFLLYVGRLAAQKNLPTLLQAFARVHEKAPESSLVIAGDGPLRSGLKRLAQRLDLEDCVLWLGNLRLHSLRAWYAAARATMLPSFHEGFGKVIVESYLMGTPVIATPFVSAHELIRDGETGFISPEFADHEWLAEKALDLIRHPEQAREMGQKGRDHVRAYLLQEDQYLERLTNIWRVTAQSRRRPIPEQETFQTS